MTIQINSPVNLDNVIGTRTHKLCKRVVCLDTGEVFASVSDAAESAGVSQSFMSAHCLGRTRTCKGKHYAYVSHTSENFEALTARLRSMSAEMADYLAWKAERDATRKANEERQRLMARLEQRRKSYENAQTRAQRALERMQEAERELNELTA